MTETYKRVCEVIGHLAGMNPAEIAPAQALGQTATPNFYWQGAAPRPLALDSLDRVNLAMQLEDEFKITMTDDEVDDPALDHVGGLVAFVQGKLDARPLPPSGPPIDHAGDALAYMLDPDGRWARQDTFPLVMNAKPWVIGDLMPEWVMEHPFTATATASPFESIGLEMPRTPTSSASSAPTTEEMQGLIESQVTNCGVIEPGPFERYSVSEDTWLRLGGHGAQAYARRIFEVGWFEGISREKDRNGRTLQIAWAAFAEREGLRP